MEEPDIYFEIHEHRGNDTWSLESDQIESQEEAEEILSEASADRPHKKFRLVRYTLTSEVVKETK
jgi:hypothetical protein